MKKFDFAVVGGDKRTACMASVLARKGYDVIAADISDIPSNHRIHYATDVKEALGKAPVILCGIPFEKEGCLFFEKSSPPLPLTELQRLLRKHHTIFGGVIPDSFRTICDKRKIACFDFMQEEPLTISNAISTAEGAILEALLHQPTRLHQSQVLVLGYGRCGRVLADKLKGLSTHVTVCSAQPVELASAAALGFHTLPLSALAREIHGFEYLFNTIPARIITRECLNAMCADALIIDIASHRIGVDYEAAASLNRRVLFCPGLPGKYAALSCAEQLTDFVINKLT